jgi:hypothetical protein
VFIEFPELAIAVEIVPNGHPRTRLLSLVDTGLTTMLRLPYYRLSTSTQLPVVEHVSIALAPQQDSAEVIAVTLECSLTARSYVTRARQFRWDFTVLLRAIVISHYMKGGVIPFHAASVTVGDDTHLLLGESGAGKSLICAAAMELGMTVVTSELTFVGGGCIRVGNHAMEVSRSALDAYQMPHSGWGSGSDSADSHIAELARGPHAARIVSITVIRADRGPMRTEPIKALRTRTVLFENALRQHPISFLVAEQAVPLLDSVPAGHLEAIGSESVLLSGLPAQVLVGHPREIAHHLAKWGAR